MACYWTPPRGLPRLSAPPSPLTTTTGRAAFRLHRRLYRRRFTRRGKRQFAEHDGCPRLATSQCARAQPVDRGGHRSTTSVVRSFHADGFADDKRTGSLLGTALGYIGRGKHGRCGCRSIGAWHSPSSTLTLPVSSIDPGPGNTTKRWPVWRDGRARRRPDDPTLWSAVGRGGSRSRSTSSRRWRRDARERNWPRR
jgi:hypothetical protein